MYNMSFNQIQKGNQKTAEKEYKERIKRVVPVAKDLLRLIGEEAEGLDLGDVVIGEESHYELSKKILQLFLDKNIQEGDLSVIFEIAMQSLSFSKQIVNKSFEITKEKTLGAYLGKDKPLYQFTLKEYEELIQASGMQLSTSKSEKKS